MKTWEQIYEENKSHIWDSDVLSNWQAHDLAVQYALQIVQEIQDNMMYYAEQNGGAVYPIDEHFKELIATISDDK